MYLVGSQEGIDRWGGINRGEESIEGLNFIFYFIFIFFKIISIQIVTKDPRKDKIALGERTELKTTEVLLCYM